MKVQKFEQINQEQKSLWKELQEKSSVKVIERIMANLEPRFILNDILIVEYCGKEEVKRDFAVYYKKYKKTLISYLAPHFQINDIKTVKELGFNELTAFNEAWISAVVKKFGASTIKIYVEPRKDKK